MKKTIILMAVLLTLMACGGQTPGGSPTAAEKNATDNMVKDSSKHSAEYITARVDSIYSLQNDSLCCTERYLALCAEADKLTQEYGMVAIDADHWTMSQDEADDWQYSIEEVSHVTDSTAQVTVNIHSFSDQKVVLDLRFERDDWYVDNFRTFFEGSAYDEDGNPLPDTEGMQEYNEQRELRKFIDDVLTKRKEAIMR